MGDTSEQVSHGAAPVGRRRGRRRVELHNRPWDGIVTASLIRGLDKALTPELLRGTLRRLHALDPLSPPVCRVEGSPRSWVAVAEAEIDAWLERIVVDERGRATEDSQMTLQRVLNEPLGAAPRRIIVGDGYLAFHSNHVIGDGTYNWGQLAVGLIGMAVSGDSPEALARHPYRVSPLVRAGMHTLLRHPTRETWREAAVRQETPMPARAVAGEGKTGALSIVSRVSEPGLPNVLRSWRDETLAGTSIAAITTAAARMALEAEGAVKPTTDSVVVFNARRYLPPGVPVTGNFSGALRLTDPRCRDPRALGEEIERDIRLALPLVSMLAVAARTALPPKRRIRIDPPSRGPVTLTHMGALYGLQELPWTAPEHERQVLMGGWPAGETGITLSTFEQGGRMNVNIFFLGEERRAAMTRAAERLVQDPIGLLKEFGTIS
jgi:hypothetical protein